MRADPPSDFTHVAAVALVDTGSTVSGIGPRLIAELGLESHQKRRLKSATEERFVPYFLFRLGLWPDGDRSALPFIFDGLDGFGRSRSSDFEVILGMDVLGRLNLSTRALQEAVVRYG
jgi:hypothetical protein